MTTRHPTTRITGLHTVVRPTPAQLLTIRTFCRGKSLYGAGAMLGSNPTTLGKLVDGAGTTQAVLDRILGVIERLNEKALGATNAAAVR